MSAKIATINLDNQDESFKSLLDYNCINLKTEGKDNFFIEKNYSLQLMTEFVKSEVARGNLIAKEGYLSDEPTNEQLKEVSEIMKKF